MFKKGKLNRIVKNLFKWLGQSITRISIATLSFIGFITSIINFIQIFLGNRQTLIIVLTIIGTLVWLTILGRLAYIGFSKREKKTGRKSKYIHKFEDHLVAKQWFIALLALTVSTTIGITVFSYYKNQELNNKILILITNISGPNPENYLVNEKLYRQLRESLVKYPDVLIMTTTESVADNNEEGSSYARKLGERYRADLILWGYYGVTETNVQITLHVENLDSSKTIPLSSSSTSELLGTIDQIDSFQIQQKVADRMTALVYFITGITRYQVDDQKNAIALFSLALESPDWAEDLASEAYVLDYRAQSYMFIGDLKKAELDFNKAIELDNNNPKFYVDRGTLFEWLGRYEKSLDDLNKAINIDQNYTLAYLRRAYTLIQLKRFNEAYSDLEYSRQLEPNRLEVYYGYAWYYYYQKDFPKAIVNASYAIELDKKNPYSYDQRARLHINIGDYEEAINDLSYAIKLRPLNSFYYNNRGVAYGFIGDFDKSCKGFEKSQELGNEKSFTSHKNLGNCYYFQGNSEKAIEEYTKAIEIGAQTPVNMGREYEVYMARAQMYAKLKEYKNALNDLNKAIELKPDLDTLYFNRGDIYLLLGDPEKAIFDFKKVLILSTDSELRQVTEKKLKELEIEP